MYQEALIHNNPNPKNDNTDQLVSISQWLTVISQLLVVLADVSHEASN